MVKRVKPLKALLIEYQAYFVETNNKSNQSSLNYQKCSHIKIKPKTK